MLIRPIRPLPIRPTADKLRRLMQEYGLTRSVVARLMRCTASSVDRYLEAQPIPLGRWELFLMKVQTIYHPDEAIELPL